MRQANCTPAIDRGAVSPVERPGLAWLWLAWLASRVVAMPDLLLLYVDRARQRRRLLELDDRMLRDIGIGRTAAWAEAQKRFWQP
jgi:uncharacterized protein YjiS (DUF1127 family)